MKFYKFNIGKLRFNVGTYPNPQWVLLPGIDLLWWSKGNWSVEFSWIKVYLTMGQDYANKAD